MAEGGLDHARPRVPFHLLTEALEHLEEDPDIQPALVKLDRLIVAMRKHGWETFSVAEIDRVRNARATVDDDPDAAYQELRSIMDSWLDRWPAK